MQWTGAGAVNWSRWGTLEQVRWMKFETARPIFANFCSNLSSTSLSNGYCFSLPSPFSSTYSFFLVATVHLRITTMQQSIAIWRVTESSKICYVQWMTIITHINNSITITTDICKQEQQIATTATLMQQGCNSHVDNIWLW